MARMTTPKPDDLSTPEGMQTWLTYGQWPSIAEAGRQLEIPQRTLARWMAQGLPKERSSGRFLAEAMIAAATDNRKKS